MFPAWKKQPNFSRCKSHSRRSMLFLNKFIKYTAWNVRLCPVLVRCVSVSFYDCCNVNVAVNAHLKVDPLMVCLKLIDFNAIDTVLPDGGTRECNYRLLLQTIPQETVGPLKPTAPNTSLLTGGGTETQYCTPPCSEALFIGHDVLFIY